MSERCEHHWAQQWFTVSARIVRGGQATYAVTNAQLDRCTRCESFLVSEEQIVRHLFRAEPGSISEVLIRLSDEPPPA